MGSVLVLILVVMIPRPAAATPTPQKAAGKASTQQLLQTAHSFYAQGDYQNARKYYLRVLPAYSKNFDILQRIGYCYFVLGKAGYPEAARYYARAYEINPHSKDVAEKLATCLMGLKHFEEAAELWSKLAEAPDAPSSIWELLAEAYQQAGNFSNAVSAYDAYLQRKPGDLAARTKLGNLYAEQKDYAKAQEQYRMALSANPNYSPALIGMGHILAGQRQFDESLKYYDRVLKVTPENGEALSGKAFALLWMGRPEEAEALFTKLHTRFPRDNEVARALAAIQALIQDKALAEARRSGNVVQLQAYYLQRLEKNPQDLEALKNLAALTASAKHCQESIGYDHRALAIAPNDASFQLALARSLALCQQPTEAIARYRQYLEARPDAQDARFELGQALLQQHQIPDAIQTFRTLLKANPSHQDALLGLAQSLAASKNYPEALARYDEVLKNSPTNYDALQGRAFVLYWTDHFTEARTIFERLAQERPSDPQNTQALQDISKAQEAAHWASLRPQPGAPPKDFEAYYRKRLASYPDDLSAMKALGYVQEQEKDYEAALRTYKEVLVKKPDDPDAQGAMERVTKYLAYNSVSHARTLAYNGGKDRVQALQILKEHLERDPEDSEARVLYGTVLSWEGHYDEAREQLQRVLAKNPDHSDALPALINVENWSDHPERAEQLAREALKRKPNDVTLMLAEAHTLRKMGRDKEALKIMDQIDALQPKNLEARRRRWSMAKEIAHYWEFKVNHTYDFFSKGFPGQHETSLSVRAPTPAGSVTLRENRADRFSLASYQTEIDFYPSLGRGTYGYLNVGYSADRNLYPRYRVGGDLFHMIGHGFEASGGYRRLQFADDVNISTVALAKYYGNWLFTGRAFLTPDKLGLSHTTIFSARRFLGSEGLHDYVEVFYSRGASLALARTTLNTIVLDSYRYGLTIDKVLGHWSASFEGAIGQEQPTFGGSLKHYTLNGSIYYRF